MKKIQKRGLVLKDNVGITIIALVITMIVCYDKNIKHSNIKSFLDFGDKKRWAKTYLFLNFLK